MDKFEYRKYSLGELGIIFKCKNCAVKTGVPYFGEVMFLKPASVDIKVSMCDGFNFVLDFLII